jgi:glycosyltransferase involved in cell wall biosynthesis
MEGYYRHRLDVVRLCLESILQNTDGEYDLVVFDNGSCPEAAAYLEGLKTAGQIDLLLLSSRNIGQIGALQALFSAAPGELIAYSDDDILFYPGWLPALLEIYNTYPQVGMVSGVPVRNALETDSTANRKFLTDSPDGLLAREERWIPEDWERDWAVSTGRDPEKWMAKTSKMLDPLLEYRQVRAFPAASHFQYFGPRQALLNALPANWLGSMMAPMADLEAGVDRQGLLRLSTTRRYVRHIGNVVTPAMAEEVQEMGIEVTGKVVSKRPRRHWILEIPRMRPLLEKLYGKLYDILHHVKY